MRKLLLISLAVLLAVSLSITMFPTRSAEASKEHTKGITFNIRAAGEGSYKVKPYGGVPEEGLGAFAIGFAGSGFSYTPGRGLAWRSSAGHVKGSFGPHEIDVNIHVWPSNSYYCKYNRVTKTIKLYGISVTGGSYDGKKVTNGWGEFDILSPDSTSITVHLNVITDAGHYLVDITIEEASADRFKIDIHEVGY